jgi:hypothetical protein
MNPKLHLLAAAIALPIVYSRASAQVCGNGVFLGQLSTNPFVADSTANKFGAFGNPYCLARSRESRHEVAVLHTGYRAAAPPPGSPMSPNNSYATESPVLCGDDD